MVSLDGMDFEDRVREISTRVSKRLEMVATEEATKNALIMPFIQGVLGYNVFDPAEVVPEYVADVGGKKGEKVDYAIFHDGKPILLIECKAYGVNLEREPAAQLKRYFQETDARVGILTDGVTYRFFTDLEKQNLMDERPFLEIDLLNPDSINVKELRNFTKATFDQDALLANARDLKYLREIKRVLESDWSEPSEEFVRYLMAQSSSGLRTKQRLEQFTRLAKDATQEFLTAKVNDRLKTALHGGAAAQDTPAPLPEETVEPEEDAVETTAEEWQAFYAIKAILRDILEPSRVGIRDRLSYCAIVVDNRATRTICRLYFHRARKYVGFFDGEREERVPVNSPDDLFLHSERLKARAKTYETT